MQRVRIISHGHTDAGCASKSVENEVNKFLENELAKIGGRIEDIKLATSANPSQCLVVAMIVYDVTKFPS